MSFFLYCSNLVSSPFERTSNIRSKAFKTFFVCDFGYLLFGSLVLVLLSFVPHIGRE